MTASLNEIDTSELLDEAIGRSHGEPVLLFKHSTTCPISSHVLRDVAELETEIQLIVVQRSRSVSDDIARRFGIRHESPQAIVIVGGQPVYHASHYDVSGDEIAEFLRTKGEEG